MVGIPRRVSFATVFDDADEALAKVNEDIQLAQQRLERLPRLREVTESARGRAASPRRDIAVEVNHADQVTALQIRDEALSRGGDRLASELVGLLNAARHDVQKQMLASATEILGEEDAGLLDPLRLSVEAEAAANDPDQTTGGLW